MGKIFNITGDCKPALHYMVDLNRRLKEIKVLIDRGEYFTINRARQYGKTTTLKALTRFLKDDYLVISLDFQELGYAKFRNENVFSLAFASIFLEALYRTRDDLTEKMQAVVSALEQAPKDERDSFELLELFSHLKKVCAASDKPIVLLIDEIDSATDNQVFLDFLAQLRKHYLNRDSISIFQSVILAGVYDVKNLKRKLRPEDAHKSNSPWNIAATFDVTMSFSSADIQGMLSDYENDHHTGMNIVQAADLIYDYTSGYPFLVSKICKLIDEKLNNTAEEASGWNKQGILEAVKILLAEKNTLFESLAGKLEAYPELKKMLYAILFQGASIPYNQLAEPIEIATMFGFVKNTNGTVAVANRIFEVLLYNLFLSEEVITSQIYRSGSLDKNQFVKDGQLDMELILTKFMNHFHDLYASSDTKFIEDNGRKFFLLYLKPIINGVGNYYIEAQTRDLRRTDIIIDYLGKQYIIEIKIWRGDEYNRRGEQQLADYLEAYHQTKGYLLSFNFNKNKVIGGRTVVCGEKQIFEVVV